MSFGFYKTCDKCLCLKCDFTMPQGDSTDCHNCDLCIEGDLVKVNKNDCENFTPDLDEF